MNYRFHKICLGSLLVLLSFCTAVSAKTFQTIEKEANALASTLKAPASVALNVDLPTLIDLANTFSAEQDCHTALQLRKKAFANGQLTDYQQWTALANDYACLQVFKDASSALWLAKEAAENEVDKAQAFANLGLYLSRREAWSDRWKPLAIKAFEEATKLGGQVDWIEAQLQTLRQQVQQFEFVSARLMDDGPTARICLSFNRSLRLDDQIRYQDYVRLKPAINADFQVEYGDLCIDGAAYNTGYQVTLLAGLPNQNLKLQKTVTSELELIHRAPALWFENSAYVLPASQQPAVLLQSINVENTELTLLKIHERNVLSAFIQQKLHRNLNKSAIRRIQSQLGEQVWQGTHTITNTVDEISLSAVSLPADIVTQPGLYVLLASQTGKTDDEYDYYEEIASQWLIISDIGLSSYQGSSGLTVVARSLATGKPLADVELVLYAKNNKPLAQQKTDREGSVQFAPGLLRGKAGKAAVQITAFGQNQGFSYLSLTRAPFDLSDRGVSGRKAPKHLDAFVYSERGVYRPGETVNAVTLLRNAKAGLIAELPLQLKLLDPQADLVLERTLVAGDLGDYVTALALSENARTGRWQISLYANKALVGQTDFLVEAITPPRIEARLNTSAVLSERTPTVDMSFDAQYLYGAPVSKRPVTSSLYLTRDAHPFDAYADYFFGAAASENKHRKIPMLELPDTRTDNDGRAVISLNWSDITITDQPLKATLRASVIDTDGAATAASAPVKLRNLPGYLGIKPRFKGTHLAANSKAIFDFALLQPDANLVEKYALSWQLIRRKTDYQWFNKNGEWGYEKIHHETVIKKGSLKKNASKSLAAIVGEGVYRLQVKDEFRGISSSFDFVAGNPVATDTRTPDRVNLSLDKKQYSAGDTALLTIDAPFAGAASLLIATDNVETVQHFSLPDKHHKLQVPVNADWGAGAYALLSVYSPGHQSATPKRAIGVVWLGLNKQPHRLSLKLATPESVMPRQRIHVPVRLDNALPGEKIKVTLAAVDAGVLNLTAFKTPQPLAHFFGKRTLAISVRDLYSRLIKNPLNQTKKLQRSGAGLSGREGAAESNIRIVSAFSGVVKVNDNGAVNIPLDLPDYNGKLRLMAVAWSDQRFGSAEKELVVKDPVVVSASLPRFLAVHDQGEVNLLIHNMAGPEGEYRLSLEGDDVVALSSNSVLTLNLSADEKQNLSFSIMAQKTGTGKLHLTLTGPENYRYQQPLELGVRGQYLPISNRVYKRLLPGQKLALSDQTQVGLLPDTAAVSTTISGGPAIDIAGLLKQLDRYPYGCLEQLTSRAMPLLFSNQLAEHHGIKQDPALKPRIQKAINEIFVKQKLDGSFSLWSDAGQSENWLTAYALEFLYKAKRAGYEVSDYFFYRGMKWLDKHALDEYQDSPEALASRVYASYVLALQGNANANAEAVRYMATQYVSVLPNAMSLGHLAAALALQGDVAEAKKVFLKALDTHRQAKYWLDYGSQLRDQAALISLLNEARGIDIDPSSLWADTLDRVKQTKWLSTQEQAWLIMAAATLGPQQAFDLTLNDVKMPGQVSPVVISPDKQALAEGILIENSGNKAIWSVTHVTGTPTKVPELEKPTFLISRELFNLKGEPLKTRQLKQGQPVVVVLEGKTSSDRMHRALWVDLLPAGLQVQAATLKNALVLDQLTWLQGLSALQYQDVLDDRFVAAMNLQASDGNEKNFKIAYIAQAVTPGKYFWPPTVLEDMYRPDLRGQGRGETLVIQAQ